MWVTGRRRVFPPRSRQAGGDEPKQRNQIQPSVRFGDGEACGLTGLGDARLHGRGCSKGGRAMTLHDEERAPERRIETTPHADSLLLREARHRIGNGLQIVAAVLLRSARTTEDEVARGHLQAAHGRVMAVAALERQLAVVSAEAVELQGYLTTLCEHMAEASIGDPAQISLRSYVDSAVVSATTASSLGMIVSELVVNALKHAFPGERRGEVTVSYDAQGADWVLTVADNGVGLPQDPPEPGLGTEIVSALARQLGASVEVADSVPGKVTRIVYSEASRTPVVDLEERRRGGPPPGG